jgi:hypothetical protein
MKMKALFISITFIVLLRTNSFAQKIDTIRLKVVSYKELKDCYIINTYNKKTSDSIYIISVRVTLILKCNYKKIAIGNEYDFICKRYKRPLTPPNSFAMIVKNTIVWRDGDDPKKMPIYCANAKGLYIRMLPQASSLSALQACLKRRPKA